MKELPILFQTDMVKALLDGRKTQTRRVKGLKEINQNPKDWYASDPIFCHPEGLVFEFGNKINGGTERITSPYGKPGDILWVRETWKPDSSLCTWIEYSYKANHHEELDNLVRWKPSIHMPKVASRIWLQVKEIRVERLHDISEEDSKAEGAIQYEADTDWLSAKFGFEAIWKEINGKESWNKNPWLWVVKFEVISTTGRAAADAKLGKEVPV